MRSLKINQSITDRQDASLGIFMREVSKLPLIDINEEIELSKRIKNGDESAVNKLVEANLRFVISVAKQYQGKGLPLVDLIQLGAQGCIEAARRWDESRGFKFISYAVWWIRQSIIKALSLESRTVRIPMNQVLYMNKINKAVEKLEQLNERTPSIDEIEEETDLSSDKISLNITAVNKSLSLDIPFKDEEAGCLLDVIPNSNYNEMEDSIRKEDITFKINSMLAQLSDRESDIIRMYFGIGTDTITLDGISVKFGVSNERIRQVLFETLDKIKENYGESLKGLL